MRKRYRPHRITEDMVENHLVDKVKAIGGMCIKGNPHNQRGMPDRICILPKGLVVFIEMKRPGRKPRPNQRLMINRMRALGQHAVWANSYGMVDKLIEWCLRTMATTKVVGTEHECTRPACDRRVKIPWTYYQQNTNF